MGQCGHIPNETWREFFGVLKRNVFSFFFFWGGTFFFFFFGGGTFFFFGGGGDVFFFFWGGQLHFFLSYFGTNLSFLVGLGFCCTCGQSVFFLFFNQNVFALMLFFLEGNKSRKSLEISFAKNRATSVKEKPHKLQETLMAFIHGFFSLRPHRAYEGPRLEAFVKDSRCLSIGLGNDRQQFLGCLPPSVFKKAFGWSQQGFDPHLQKTMFLASLRCKNDPKLTAELLGRNISQMLSQKAA